MLKSSSACDRVLAVHKHKQAEMRINYANSIFNSSICNYNTDIVFVSTDG